MSTSTTPDPAREPRDESDPGPDPEPREEKNRDEIPPDPGASVHAPDPPITDDEAVDEASDESFPASDPPSFTPTKI